MVLVSIIECRKHPGRQGYFLISDDLTRGAVMCDDKRELTGWPQCLECQADLSFFVPRDHQCASARFSRTWLDD